jgi:hypothetical protein
MSAKGPTETGATGAGAAKAGAAETVATEARAVESATEESSTNHVYRFLSLVTMTVIRCINFLDTSDRGSVN